MMIVNVDKYIYIFIYHNNVRTLMATSTFIKKDLKEPSTSEIDQSRHI